MNKINKNDIQTFTYIASDKMIYINDISIPMDTIQNVEPTIANISYGYFQNIIMYKNGSSENFDNLDKFKPLIKEALSEKQKFDKGKLSIQEFHRRFPK